MKELRLLPAVPEDTAQAARWYDEAGYVGLGERFLAVFYSTLHQIQRQGEICRAVYEDFRRVLLNPFPWSVVRRTCGAPPEGSDSNLPFYRRAGY
jgi:hypothetical protein